MHAQLVIFVNPQEHLGVEVVVFTIIGVLRLEISVFVLRAIDVTNINWLGSSGRHVPHYLAWHLRTRH
jgi:hypothetical protein